MRLAVLALLSVGCVHKQQIMYTDGQPAYIAKCDATMIQCLQVATRDCPTGYEIVKEYRMDEQKGSIGGANGVVVGGSSSKAMVGFVFRCKAITP